MLKALFQSDGVERTNLLRWPVSPQELQVPVNSRATIGFGHSDFMWLSRTLARV